PGLCSGYDSDGARCRSFWSLPERVALFDCGSVPVAAGALSVDVFSLAARDSGAVCARVWRAAGSERDGGGGCVAARDESDQGSYATARGRVLGSDCQRRIRTLPGDDSLRARMISGLDLLFLEVNSL